MKKAIYCKFYPFDIKRFSMIISFMLTIIILLTSCAPKNEVLETTVALSESSLSPETTAPVDTSAETTAATVTEPIPSNSLGAVNPLTGVANMRYENLGMRSIGIVVNNHIYSIPQRGLHRADVIYEYETEGGQTRLLAMFADISTVPEIGSLRSARVISSDLCAGTNSIYIHFGYNERVPDHLKQNNIQAIDGNVLCAYSGHSVDGKITLSDNLFFYRDDAWKRDREQIEHTAVTNGNLLLGAIEYKNISIEGETPQLFNFTDASSPSLEGGSTCSDLTVFFSLTNDDSNFVYDKEIMMYTKYQYNGTLQIDEITGEAIFVKNVFVLFAHIEPHGDPGGTIDAFLEEGGEGYYASEGKIIEIKWEKDSPNSLIEIFDTNGNPVQVNAGRSYINIVRRSRSSQTTWK